MAESHEITHFLPDVGSVSAKLFCESFDLYSALDSKGEISRLRQLNQLGMVHVAWKAARHSRWEFIVLLLDLVRRSVHLDGIHLKSKVNLGNGYTASSAQELLSCWALLLSLGHLHGTFVSEAELLFVIRRGRTFRKFEQELLDACASESGRRWIRSILDKEDTYRLHQVISIFRLKLLLGGDPRHAEWESMLLAYLVASKDESAALTRARALFRRIRRLAFLSLDSSLTPTPLEVRLAQLASAPESLARLVAPHWRSDIDGDELSGLQEFLSREIYNGKDVLLAAESRRRALRQRLERDLLSQGLTYVIQTLATTDLLAGSKLVERDLHVVARGDVRSPYLELMSYKRTAPLLRRRLEDSFSRWASVQDVDVRLHFVRDAGNAQLVFQVHAKGDDRRNFAAGLAGACQLSRRLRSMMQRPYRLGFEQHAFSSIHEGILLGYLQHFFGKHIRWEWEEERVGLRVIAGTKVEVCGHIAEQVADHTMHRSRRHELESTMLVVRNMKAKILHAAIANVRGFLADSEAPMCEIDGVIAAVDPLRGDIVLGLIEAKTRGSGNAEGACRKQLAELFATMPPQTGVRRRPLRSTGGARRARSWVYLRSSYSG